MEQKADIGASQEINQVEIAKQAWDFVKQNPMILVIAGIVATGIGWVLKMQNTSKLPIKK